DNHCWFVTSDIVWDECNEVCSGYSCILSDDGELVAKAEPFQETILSHSISLAALNIRKKTRLYGNPELFEIVKKTYEQTIDNKSILPSFQQYVRLFFQYLIFLLPIQE